MVLQCPQCLIAVTREAVPAHIVCEALPYESQAHEWFKLACADIEAARKDLRFVHPKLLT